MIDHKTKSLSPVRFLTVVFSANHTAPHPQQSKLIHHFKKMREFSRFFFSLTHNTDSFIHTTMPWC